MGTDLLKKEEEYRKLNEQLQMKTKEIMNEADAVMRMQDNILKETYPMPKRIAHEANVIANVCSKVGHLTGDPNIPDSVNEMGAKGMNHYFRAKIKAMQADFEKLQSEYKVKCEELKKLQKDNQNLMEDKEKWFHMMNSSKTTIAKLENQVAALSSRVQSKENENAAFRKEIEQLKKELKGSNLSLNNAEVRLNRAVEESEKLKATLKSVKQEEKDNRELYRKQLNELNATIKRIERHKNELLCGFKKQMSLIDNLKKQKACLEALKVADVSEADFLKILDMKLED